MRKKNQHKSQIPLFFFQVERIKQSANIRKVLIKQVLLFAAGWNRISHNVFQVQFPPVYCEPQNFLFTQVIPLFRNTAS